MGYMASHNITQSLAGYSKASGMLLLFAGLARISNMFYVGSFKARDMVKLLNDELPEILSHIIEVVSSRQHPKMKALALTTILVIGKYVDNVFQMSLATRKLLPEEIAHIQAAIKGLQPLVTIFPDLKESLTFLQTRTEIQLQFLEWHILFLHSVFTGDMEGRLKALHNLEGLLGQALVKEEMWPWSIAFAGKNAAKYHRVETFLEAVDTIMRGYGYWPPQVECSGLQSPWTAAYGKLFAVENMFEAAVEMKDWPFAADLKLVLERLAPGYFTTICCVSDNWVWKRCLLAALIEEGLNHHDMACRYALQSMGWLEMSRDAELDDAEDKSGLFSTADALRPSNLYAKIMIQARQRGVTLTSNLRTGQAFIVRRPYEFQFLVGDHIVDDIKNYVFLALLFLEKMKALSLFEQAMINQQDAEAVQKWAKVNRNMLVWKELKGISKRALRPSEKIELDALEADFGSEMELMWHRSTIRPPWQKTPFISDTGVTDTEYIPGNAVVIYTSISDEGLAVMCFSWAGLHGYEFFEKATTKEIGRAVHEFLGNIRTHRMEANLEILVDVMKYLSCYLTLPFEDTINMAGHVIFVPSGPLCQFPFGCLFHNGEALAFGKAVSQVPSLSYLRHLMTRPKKDRSKQNHHISVIARPGSYREQALGGEAPLPLAGIEALCISNLHRTTCLKAQDTGREEFNNALNHPFVHIATHRKIDAESPLLSEISLGEPTRVIDMLASRSRADVVVFSACNSASGYGNSGDDVVGFSHSILAAGADLFIGSLWTTNDISTMLHMLYFHLEILEHRDENVATTWQRATVKLYDTTTEEARNILQSLITSWEKWEMDGKNPGNFVKGGRKHLEAAIRNLTTRDGEPTINFRHPYVWAPFILCGYSEIRVKRAGLAKAEEDN
jgi:CHAT domain-containing protein